METISSLAQETAVTRSRYNRIAPVYDAIEWVTEAAVFQQWRNRLWSLVPAGRVLEVGVGTGKNFPFYPNRAAVAGIDLSQRMLDRSRLKSGRMEHDIRLNLMDAQRMGFSDNAFDAAVATFVFCSVPDAQRGLRELGRVVKPDGRIYLLEHVRIDQPGIIGHLMDWFDPVVVRLVGAHINRRTADNVKLAGLVLEEVEELAPLGLVKLIVARA